MSFVSVEDVQKMMEGLMVHLFKEILDISLETPFPWLTYDEAMIAMGSIKPDIRFGMELRDVSDLMKRSSSRCSKRFWDRAGS